MATGDQDRPLSDLPVPEAVPNGAAYQSERERALAFSARRRENYERYMASDRRSAVVDYMPVRLDFENVSRCNFRCTMCQVSDWPKMTRAGDMAYDDFARLLDEQTGLVEIKLQGMGEPLLAADDYFKMIALARSRHLWVRSTTNGSLLHLKDNHKRLIDSGICEVQLSIDGATKPTYEAIRRNGNFEKVVDNCTRLNTYARDVGLHRTRMWVVVQQANFAELELFPKLAAEMGFARLTFSLDLGDWGQDCWRAVYDEIDVHRQFDVARARALVAAAARHGVEATFWFVDDKYHAGQKDKLCPWPFERAYVSSDMRVVPCCMIANPAILDLGDAHDFTAVWRGETMRAFRRAHLEGRIPDVCKTCYKL